MYTSFVRLRESVRNFFARRTAKIRNSFRKYAERQVTSGYIPRPSRLLQIFGRHILARLWIFIQFGRIKVIGKENLKLPGRFIFCPNHTHTADGPLLFPVITRKNLHMMAAHDVMQGAGGWLGILMGKMGCYPVDRNRGHTVVRPSIKLLVEGKSLVIFPDGKVYWKGECARFKRGAAFIAQHAQEILGDAARVALVPIQMVYGKRDVGSIDTGFKTMGLKWRGGVTITVGKPLYVDELQHLSTHQITELLHDFICHAQPQLPYADRLPEAFS